LLLSVGACGTAAAARPQQMIDISGQQGAQQQTRRPTLLLSIEGTDGRTDTDTGSVNKLKAVNFFSER